MALIAVFTSVDARGTFLRSNQELDNAPRGKRCREPTFQETRTCEQLCGWAKHYAPTGRECGAILNKENKAWCVVGVYQRCLDQCRDPIRNKICV